MVEPGKRHTSGHCKWDRPVPAGSHSSVFGRQRPHVKAALDPVSLPGGLRLQAAVHHQRVLRPGPHGLLPGSPGRTTDKYGHDGLDRIFSLSALLPSSPRSSGEESWRFSRDILARRHDLTDQTGARPSSCAGVQESYHQRVRASVPRNSAAHAPT